MSPVNVGHKVCPRTNLKYRLAFVYPISILLYILPLIATLCDLVMLEQLQRLQAHIGVLKTRLHHLERENTSLTEAKALAETDHHAQIVQKNSIITQKQEKVDNLTEQLTQLQDQFKQLN